MELCNDKIYLSAGEWRLLGKTPPGVDLDAMAEEDQVMIAPIRTDYSSIIGFVSEVSRILDSLESEGASSRQLFLLDSLAVRAIRLAGYDLDSFVS